MVMHLMWKLWITTRSKNMIYNGLTPIHPGEYLAEILEELHISQASFARTIGVSPMRAPQRAAGIR